MATMLVISGQGITKEKYEQLRKEVNWEGNPPKGEMLHAAAFKENNQGIQVVNIYASEEDWNDFLNSRLMPVFQKMNMPPPKVEAYETHNINTFPPLEKFRVAQAQ